MALIGVGMGIAGALALARFSSSLLYGLRPTGLLTFIAVSLILIANAALTANRQAQRSALLPEALLALTHLCPLHYPADEKMTKTQLPQPATRQQEILKAQ